MKNLTLTQPDDWHLHVRNGAMLKAVIAHTARQFSRAIIMPNLVPPVTTLERASVYKSEIMSALPDNSDFQPLMTLYLTAETAEQEIRLAAESDTVYGIKLYPAGVTTNSAAGVSELKAIYPLLEVMQTYNIPLLVHAEVSDPDIDIFDREKIFIEQHLSSIHQTFPELKIVVEHVSTAEAVDFVRSTSNKVAATITPQHLMYNRNALLSGGIKPHHYCLPILKREKHRQALLKAATSGNSKFFLGTDSAPHLQSNKENSCGCAGCYSAHAAIELYAQVFENEKALDKLEAFASFFGPDFYGLKRNKKKITLNKENWKVPEFYSIDSEKLSPLMAGNLISWKLAED